MSIWDNYRARATAHGTSKHDVALNREARVLSHKIPDSLSYHPAVIFDQAHTCDTPTSTYSPESFERNVAIINSDNLNEKHIYSLPGEDIEHGSVVKWMDNYWLVTERDANTTIYTKAKLVQCNYLLKWITPEGVIHQQWCIIEDGTKLRVLSFRVEKSACIKYLSNCWNPLKPTLLQRKDERCLCVIVAKAERKCRIA